VTEVARTGAQLVGVAATPANRLIGTPDLANRTANVQIIEGDLSSQTIVTFTNKNVPPPPKNGLVKICKKAGPGVKPGSTFTFTLATRATRSVDVKAGFCSSPQEVPVGNLTVTEKATNGLRVSDITVDPAGARVGSADLTAGTVTVAVEASRVVTEVTFTNRSAEPGTLKVCKVAGTGVVRGTPFRFTVGSTPVQVRAGSCSLPMSAPAGNLAITEAPAEGTRVTDITVAGAGSLVSRDLKERTATVNVAPGSITEAVFTNTKPSTPVRGCVWTVKYFKKHHRITAKLVPSGGLSVGSDKLSAKQANWALKAGQRRNFRFKLQSELIAALLNQLGGASTPSKVQAAVDAAQLLLSHGDGASTRASGTPWRPARTPPSAGRAAPPRPPSSVTSCATTTGASSTAALTPAASTSPTTTSRATATASPATTASATGEPSNERRQGPRRGRATSPAVLEGRCRRGQRRREGPRRGEPGRW
jgi:hypothetical protein